ncbi:MAG: carboxylating nicotinate-nucleotide diphosphorylase [Alphaproteobacteria bacterium]
MTQTNAQLPKLIAEPVLRRALQEDLADAGDLTAQLLHETGDGKALITARHAGILSGVEAIDYSAQLVDHRLNTQVYVQNGDTLEQGTIIAQVSGPWHSIFTAERTILNMLQRMSGIATLTASYVAETHGTKTRILCTRKTTPGLRAWEKQAVRHGGGVNHRFGLHDGVMLKDNHIAAHGSITKALEKARELFGPMVRIEIECDDIEQVREAVLGRADIIMFDNMSPHDVSRALDIVDGKSITEASGGLSLEDIATMARTGVDYISVGKITHSAPALDIGLDVPF